MVATDTFENLKELQDVLVNKYDLEKKIEEAPKQLTSQEELLSKLKKEYIEKNTKYEALKSVISDLQFELDEAVRSREEGEKGMDNISTHREYEALDKQISEASIKENDLRKQLEQERKKQQALDDELRSDEELIKSQEKELDAAKSKIDKQVSEYKSKVEALQADENKISPNLDQEILFKFQRIIQRNSQGIVAVKNGVCTGCHMILPAQFANTVREGENILFCPYCSRILFYEEAGADETESYFNLEDAGSLVDYEDFSDEYDEDEEEDREADLYEKASEFSNDVDDNLEDDDEDEIDDEDDSDEDEA